MASPLGTISYIIDEEAVLVRVNNGWQYLQVIKLTANYFVTIFSLTFVLRIVLSFWVLNNFIHNISFSLNDFLREN